MNRRSGLWLFAVVYSSIGFSIYFALGIVAGRGLGLTPLIFLASGLLFLLTMLTYGEGASMFREPGGASTFARHAFNELVSFIAGWAILIDYLIVIALAAISAVHYLNPIPWIGGSGAWEIGLGATIVVGTALFNIRGITGRSRPLLLAMLAVADVALQVLLILIGVIVVWQPEVLTAGLDLFTTPTTGDIIYAAVIAMLAYAGIEAAANLAPDVDVGRRQLRRIVVSGGMTLPLTYAGMAFVALMAVPVIEGPEGPATALGDTYVKAPFLGVVAAFDPDWLATTLRWLVVLIAVPTLAWAANISMLGVSRHVSTLALNRQIPSWLGKLGRRHKTPYVAITISALIAIGLILPTNIRLLAELYALGATLAMTIAHLSILRLRWRDPRRYRPFKVPLTIAGIGPGGLPVPVAAGALLSAAAFVSVLVYHDAARLVGGAWMVFGIAAYVIYRRGFEGTSLTARVMVTETDLTKSVPEAAYRSILVPVFGTALDDDIVGTAGRLAAAAPAGKQRGRPRLDLIAVVPVPLTRPLEAPLSGAEMERANSALERALEVASEYPDVDVSARVLRARTVQAGIIAAAREDPVEMIVVGGEPPSPTRGGAIYGGIGGQRPPEVGPVTEYVLRMAPCRVLLTAPPDQDPPPPSVAPAADGSWSGGAES